MNVATTNNADRKRAFGEPIAEDKQFDPWRVPASPAMAGVVASIIADLADYERMHSPRQRKRRATDQASHEATVAALVCDLAYRHLTGHAFAVFVSRSKETLSAKSRYKAPALTSKLPAVLDALTDVGLIRQDKAKAGEDIGRRQTTIQATPKLTSRLAGMDVWGDIKRGGRPESIVLRGPKNEDEYDPETGPDIGYADTSTTDSYRAEMDAINDWLESADINFDESVLPDGDALPDVSRRRLYRVFTNGSFESGGRMAGGFWMNRKAKLRLAGLIIGGETVASIDFGQIGPRILYRLAGHEAPEGDLYAIPGLANWRGGVKTVINAAMNSAKTMIRKPMNTTDTLPRDWTFGDVMRAIEATHRPIVGQFYRGVGHSVSLMESNIAVKTLLDLKEAGIVALPVHDEFLVPRSKAKTTADIMKAAYADVMAGGSIPVSGEEWSVSQEAIVPMSL